MIDVVLYEPEIPPNTGNIIRLCANTGARLHLVHPLGFRVDDKSLERAGLDYHEFVAMKQHADWQSCLGHFTGRRLFALTTRTERNFATVRYAPDDVFVFGPESRGLPLTVLEAFPPERRVRIPMRPGNRSLNLSNAVAVAVYEAWRQADYRGC